MAIGMQGVGMSGNWLMSPFNGWGGGFGQMPQQPMSPPAFGGGGGFSPMQPSYGGMPGFGGGGGFSPMQPPGGMPGFGGGGQMPGMGGGARNPAYSSGGDPYTWDRGGMPGVGPGVQMGPGMGGGASGGMRPSMPGVGPGVQMGPGMRPGMQGPPAGGMPRDVRDAIPRGIRWKGDTRGLEPSRPQGPPQSSGGSSGSSQGMDISGFSQNTRGFDGQNYSNPGDYWNKVGAFVNNINEDRSKLSAQSGQQAGPPPQRDLAGAWDRAGEMVQGGWKNPFGQAQPVMPAQQQGGFPPVPQGGSMNYAGGGGGFNERGGASSQGSGQGGFGILGAAPDDRRFWGEDGKWKGSPVAPPAGGQQGKPAGGAYSAYGSGYGAMGGPSGGGVKMPEVTDSRPKDPRNSSFNPNSPTWNDPGNAAARDRYNSNTQFFDNWAGSTDDTLKKLRGQGPQGKWLGFR